MRVSVRASQAIYGALDKIGVDFVVTFPCNWTSLLLDLVAQDKKIKHVPVTREEEGIGVAAGGYLGGKKPAIIMQSSGIGNSLNALLSLNQTYKIPLLLLISHRGVEREKIVAQKGIGQALEKLLEAAEIPFLNLSEIGFIDETIASAFNQATTEEKPVAVILSPMLLLEEREERRGRC